jgi:hypothetical protein
MRYYAGIGSRNITLNESTTIKKLAKLLAKRDWIVYSGNASGADISFQEGSKHNCVVFLPWLSFNRENYNPNLGLDYFVINQNHHDAWQSVNRYHPRASSLKPAVKALMARNYCQVMGHKNYPPVEFVLCCADEDSTGILGGTGQACRIALDKNIPVINLRSDNWKSSLRNLIK